jgi:CheY-like chemotaxis protein
MKKMIQVILVNHIPEIKKEIEKSISDSGISCQVKNVLNGGHALLHLFHLHLNNKVNEAPILILLNLNTPIVNGLEFLKEYRTLRDFKKENICVAIIDNDLTSMQKEKAESLGFSNFLSTSLFAGFLEGLDTVSV